MKTINYGIFAVAAAALALAPRAYAFHSGGVAECEGCHTMHNTKASGRGNPSHVGTGNGAVYLLQGGDQSSTCLNCHNSADTVPTGYHISTDDSMLAPGKPPVEMTPGGDFAWLKKNYNTTVRGTVTVNGNDGNTHGHNIIAADYGYAVDPDNTLAPGGTYPASSLSCVSCHDPHGTYRRLADNSIVRGAGAGLAGAGDTIGAANTPVVNKVPPIYGSGSYNNSISPTANVSAVGVYRILGGIGYQPKSVTGSYAFTTGQPVAVAPSSYNRSEGISQTHVAYGSGMSEWCANCHGAMLENAYATKTAGHKHPAGNLAHLSSAIAANYNAYVTSGDMSNTDPNKAWSSIAPIELGTSDYSVLKPLAVNSDTVDMRASTTTNVMCLSCHRAHASAFAEGTRFLTENEFMTVGDATGATVAPAYDGSTTENKINQGYSVAEQQAAYYGRPASFFGPYARNYCNKCHAKD